MLIDLHAHSSGISLCCRIDARDVLIIAKEMGIDGVVLTNHYPKYYVGDGNANAFAKKYVEEFHYAKRLGDELNVKVFFGIEVSAELYPNVHLLIYGVDEDFPVKYPDMYDYTQEKLYNVVHENGGILVQAHPFRNGTTVLDVNYLDGVEINCHPLYGTSCSDELIKIAAEHGLILTCGGDYHADTYRPICGTYIDDGIDSGVGIGRFLASQSKFKLRIHEPNTPAPKTMEIEKTAR